MVINKVEVSVLRTDLEEPDPHGGGWPQGQESVDSEQGERI